MYKKINECSHYFIQIVIFIFVIMVSVSTLTCTAANWSDQIKNNILMENPRTLKGKVFLDQPIVAATVYIYDKYGMLLYSATFSTDENGSFSVTEPLPETFLVVVREGLKNGEPFDYEVKRYIYNFNEEYLYKLNAITTLMTEYHDRHPNLSFAEVGEVVAKHLSLPETEDINDIIYCSEWHCNSFSHYEFMKAAQAAGGFTEFIEQSCSEMDLFGSPILPPGFYTVPMPVYSSADSSISSSLFSKSMGELLGGVAYGVGKEAGGLLLNLVFQGLGTDSRFGDLENSLNEIENNLEQIQESLDTLIDNLEIDTNELETQIVSQNVSDAINSIEDKFDTLLLYSNNPKSLTKASVENFAENILGAWDISKEVANINTGIIPNIGNNKGLLDLWTDFFLFQGRVDDGMLMGYYLTLEQYFSELLFHQFKGVNLVVEALDYDHQYEPGDRSLGAQFIEDFFHEKLKEQTDNFMKNVTRLVVNNCDFYSANDFMNGGVSQRIIARANWFTTQVLGEKLDGFWVSIVGPSNLVDDIVDVMDGVRTCTPNMGGVSKKICTDYKWSQQSIDNCQTFSVKGPVVDTWGTLYDRDFSKLRKDDSYTLLIVNFGDDPELGYGSPERVAKYYNPITRSWDVLEGGSPGSQQHYTEEYVLDPGGNKSYACALYNLQRRGRKIMMDQDFFTRHFYDKDRSDVHDAQWWTDRYLTEDRFHHWLHTRADDSQGKYNSGIHMNLDEEWWHPFSFEGDQKISACLTIDHDLTKTSSTKVEFDNNYNHRGFSEIGYRIGIYDVDNKKILKEVKKTFTSNGTHSERLKKQIFFDLDPGGNYYVFVRHWAKSSANVAKSESKIESDLYNLSLSFVESE